VPPFVGVAVKFTVVPEHTVVLFAAMLTLGVTAVVTVIVTALLVAVAVDAHVALLVITTVIASPFVGEVNAYVADVAPVMFTPFFFHWYVGVVPPLVGVAVKFTAVPEHTVVLFAAILTLGVTAVVTVIVTALLVAVLVDAHVALLVITTVIKSPLAGEVNAYVAEVAPVMFTPFFFHWYVGVVPPFVGVAMKFTAVPVHTVVLLAAILTEGVTAVVTVIVTGLLFTTVADGQTALLVICKVMISPLTKTSEVYVADVAPLILEPFFFHW
jgi:hypothetical protein